MFTGHFDTPKDAVTYAESIYIHAGHDFDNAMTALWDAVDRFKDFREDASPKYLRRLRYRVTKCNRDFEDAKKRLDYARAYLQGVRDMVDALGI